MRERGKRAAAQAPASQTGAASVRGARAHERRGRECSDTEKRLLFPPKPITIWKTRCTSEEEALHWQLSTFACVCVCFICTEEIRCTAFPRPSGGCRSCLHLSPSLCTAVDAGAAVLRRHRSSPGVQDTRTPGLLRAQHHEAAGSLLYCWTRAFLASLVPKKARRTRYQIAHIHSNTPFSLRTGGHTENMKN